MEQPKSRVVADVLGRKVLVREVRNEFAERLRIHHRARKHVVADFGPLFEYQNGRGLDRRPPGSFCGTIEALDLSHEVDRRREGGGTGSYV
jgi:hypothetical protein